MPKTKVLVIEDDRSLVEVLSYNLKAAGYETIVATDGQDGLLKAQMKLPVQSAVPLSVRGSARGQARVRLRAGLWAGLRVSPGQDRGAQQNRARHRQRPGRSAAADHQSDSASVRHPDECHRLDHQHFADADRLLGKRVRCVIRGNAFDGAVEQRIDDRAAVLF